METDECGRLVVVLFEETGIRISFPVDGVFAAVVVVVAAALAAVVSALLFDNGCESEALIRK